MYVTNILIKIQKFHPILYTKHLYRVLLVLCKGHQILKERDLVSKHPQVARNYFKLFYSCSKWWFVIITLSCYMAWRVLGSSYNTWHCVYRWHHWHCPHISDLILLFIRWWCRQSCHKYPAIWNETSPDIFVENLKIFYSAWSNLSYNPFIYMWFVQALP